MYTLRLTDEERRAFDWVGDRYNAGAVAELLRDCCPEESAWTDPAPIDFAIPESVAWRILELAEEEDFAWPCFAPGLAAVLNALCCRIV